jgi:hypothetical protein
MSGPARIGTSADLYAPGHLDRGGSSLARHLSYKETTVHDSKPNHSMPAMSAARCCNVADWCSWL